MRRIFSSCDNLVEASHSFVTTCVYLESQNFDYCSTCDELGKLLFVLMQIECARLVLSRNKICAKSDDTQFLMARSIIIQTIVIFTLGKKTEFVL